MHHFSLEILSFLPSVSPCMNSTSIWDRMTRKTIKYKQVKAVQLIYSVMFIAWHFILPLPCVLMLFQESRIYAVAKSGMRLSEVAFGCDSPSCSKFMTKSILRGGLGRSFKTLTSGCSGSFLYLPVRQDAEGDTRAHVWPFLLTPTICREFTPFSPSTSVKGHYFCIPILPSACLWSALVAQAWTPLKWR